MNGAEELRKWACNLFLTFCNIPKKPVLSLRDAEPHSKIKPLVWRHFHGTNGFIIARRSTSYSISDKGKKNLMMSVLNLVDTF